ncbi:MAG: hypothetical protein HY547_00620 [Elusimicrobia bacterium]|nr:hypothetical protein [Elusimicrobiota bacterium]
MIQEYNSIDGWTAHATSGGDLLFDRVGADQPGNKLTITNSGNIGIGTSDPQAPLDVAGKVKATSFEGDGAIPAGAILLFASTTSITNCPEGFKFRDDFDGLFPKGTRENLGTGDPDAAGSTGGSATHTHTFSGDTDGPSDNTADVVAADVFNVNNAPTQTHKHHFNFAVTGETNPPFIRVVFCEKK